MKKILASFLAITLFIGAAQAQDKGTMHRGKGKKVGHEMMMKDLNLTEAQKTQMKQLRERQHAELKTVNDNGSLTQTQAREQRKAIMEKYKTQMHSILTPEQKAKMDAKKKEHSQKTTYNRNGNLMKAADKLNLTADQKAKLTSIHSDFKTQSEAIKNNSGLTREQKKTQMEALATAHKNQAKEVLTDEQEKKAEAMLKNHKARTRK